jgi:hypothetical protein
MPFSTKLFESNFENPPIGGSSPDFNNAPVGSGEVVDNAPFGLVGKSLRVKVQDADSQCGVNKSLTATAKVIDFFFKFDPSNNNLTNNQGKLILKTWAGANFSGADLFGLMVRRTGTNTIEFGLTSNTSNFANSAFTPASYSLNQVQSGTNTQAGNWFRLVVSLHRSGFIDLFVDGAIVPSLSIPATGYTASTAFQSFHLGKFFQGSTGWGNNTTMYFDELQVYDNHYIQTNDADRAKAAGLGFLQRYVRGGCVIRYPDTEAKPDTYFGGPRKVDSCSEGQAYGLMLAVQLNDKSTFDAIEQYNYSVYDRRNRNQPAGNFMSWIHDPTRADVPGSILQFPDNAYAIDADGDRCMALLWADAKWGSSGNIPYLQRAIAIARDIADITGYLSSNNLRYMLSGGNAGTLTLQNGFNVSYFMNYLFFKLKQVDTPYSTKYQQLIDGSNDMLNKVSDSSGGIPTTVGLYPDWNGWNAGANDVTIPPETWMGQDYKYDAIRTPIRSYLSYLWYNDLPNQVRMSGNLYNFLSGQYANGSGSIKAEYVHSNGAILGNYENTMMWALNSWVFKIKGDNTNYNSILTNKVKTTYQESAGGDAYGYYTGLQQNGYFGSFWNSFTMMLDSNLITNFGATVNPPLQPDTRYYRLAVYPELNSGKIRTYLK